MTKRILKLSQPGDVVGNFRVIKRERFTYELSKYKNGKQGRIKRNMLLCECLLCGKIQDFYKKINSSQNILHHVVVL